MPWWGGGGREEAPPPPVAGEVDAPLPELEAQEARLRQEVESRAAESLEAWEAARAQLAAARRRDATVAPTFAGLPNPSQVRPCGPFRTLRVEPWSVAAPSLVSDVLGRSIAS